MGSFILRGQGADLTRDAIKVMIREEFADGGIPGTELVQDWCHKDAAGFGEEL